MMTNEAVPVLICFAATKEWWAAILRWLLRSEYNHSFVMFACPLLGRWEAIDITKDGVQICRAKTSLSRVKKIECWKYRRSFASALQASEVLIGSKYDWLGLVVNIFRLMVWRVFGCQWRRPLHDVTKFMCFEFVITLMQMAGISESMRLEPSVTEPETLRRFMKENGGFEVVVCPVEVA